jgi:hypothetical protein
VNAKMVFVSIIFFSNRFFAQVSEQWVMQTLQLYAPTSFYIVNQYKINGNSISFEGRSSTWNMSHLEYCDMSSKTRFLSTISTAVHETTHAYDSQIPYMFAKQGIFKIDNSDNEGFIFDENNKIAYNYPKSKLFQSRRLSAVIPKNLRTFRYDTYIESKSDNQSTQSSGVIGLMEEFNAYYHGSKVIFDLLPIYKEEFGTNFLWAWSSDFTANADAFYEFDFFIKEYLLYAKTNNPELYEDLKKDHDFKTIYKNIRSRFHTLIAQYEKKYDDYMLLAQKSKDYIYSSKKHADLIFPVLSEHIKSTRYEEINRIFLNN